MQKYFCCSCLEAFCTEEILKCYTKDCFKINEKQKIIMPKKANTLTSKVTRENTVTIYNLWIF